MSIIKNLIGIFTLDDQSIDWIANNNNLTIIAIVLLIFESFIAAFVSGFHPHQSRVDTFDPLVFNFILLSFLIFNICSISFLTIFPVTRIKGIKFYLRSLGFAELFIIIGSFLYILLIIIRLIIIGVIFFFLSFILSMIVLTIELKNTLQIPVQKAALYCIIMIFSSLIIVSFTAFPYFVFTLSAQPLSYMIALQP